MIGGEHCSQLINNQIQQGWKGESRVSEWVKVTICCKIIDKGGFTETNALTGETDVKNNAF